MGIVKDFQFLKRGKEVQGKNSDEKKATEETLKLERKLFIRLKKPSAVYGKTNNTKTTAINRKISRERGTNTTTTNVSLPHTMTNYNPYKGNRTLFLLILTI